MNIDGQVLSVVLEPLGRTRVTTTLEEVQRATDAGKHERAGRLHGEIRPQSSTGFMTLTRSFCLHENERGAERGQRGQLSVYGRESFVKRILD